MQDKLKKLEETTSKILRVISGIFGVASKATAFMIFILAVAVIFGGFWIHLLVGLLMFAYAAKLFFKGFTV